MKARATGNHSHNDVDAIGAVVNNAPGTRQRGYSNQDKASSNVGGFSAAIAVGDDVDLSQEERSSELESSLPVSLKCLSVVSHLDEGLLVALLQDTSVSKFRQRDSILHPDEPDDRSIRCWMGS
jgi:hypothetical protein